MKPLTKTYLKTGTILCCIGAGAALLISLANLLTNSKIKENEIKAKNQAMGIVFPQANFGEQENIDDGRYCQYRYQAFNQNDESLGFVYFASGKNMYGSISLMVGIENGGSIGNISLVENTESYASTIEDNYVTPYQNGKSSLNDVNCGATYGATLIKDMANEALAHYLNNQGGNN